MKFFAYISQGKCLNRESKSLVYDATIWPWIQFDATINKVSSDQYEMWWMQPLATPEGMYEL